MTASVLTRQAERHLAWERFARAPSLFVEAAFRIELDGFQREALDALPGERRVAIRSGHGVGKTTSEALAVVWGLVVLGALVPCTAPTEQQLRDVLWPEIARWANRNELIARELEITEKRIQLKRDPTVRAVARVAKTPEGLAGFHAARLLYVVDEAAGVPEQSMAVVEGALTTQDARCLMAGNPTKPTGYFIDAFGRNQDRWHTLTVNCEDSPRVSPDWLADMERTWGRDSDVYRVRVRGLPPQGELKGFVPPHLVDEAFARHDLDPHGDGPLILGVDVARYGIDKTVIAVRRGHTIERLYAYHGLSNPQVAAKTAEIAGLHATDDEKAAIRVDDAGVGGGVTDLLNVMVAEGNLDAHVNGLNFGGKGDRHYSTNAGVWWGQMRRLLQEGQLVLPRDDELKQQLVTRAFATNTAGKIVLEPKDHMRDRGVPSPDKGDACALAFAPAPGEGLLAWYAERQAARDNDSED